MIRANLIAERIAIEAYRQMIALPGQRPYHPTHAGRYSGSRRRACRRAQGLAGHLKTSCRLISVVPLINRPFKLCTNPIKSTRRGNPMKYARAIAFAGLAGITIIGSDSIRRNRRPLVHYVDDAAITTAVRASSQKTRPCRRHPSALKHSVAPVTSVRFAKSGAEKMQGRQHCPWREKRQGVRNDIVVRP